jgi:hypothetical protein
MISYFTRGDEPSTEDSKLVSIRCESGTDGITVQHEGTGCKDGDYAPIFIEWYDGKPRIIIWADINQEDPTHIIDLSEALETNRIPDEVRQ